MQDSYPASARLGGRVSPNPWHPRARGPMNYELYMAEAIAEARRGADGVTNLARNPAMPHQLSVVSGVREAEARRLVAESASV